MKARHKSMKAFGENLALANEQLKIINNETGLPHFDDKYELVGEGPLKATVIEIFQINLGKIRFASIAMLMPDPIEKKS